jgi:hypothetical protein
MHIPADILIKFSYLISLYFIARVICKYPFLLLIIPISPLYTYKVSLTVIKFHQGLYYNNSDLFTSFIAHNWNVQDTKTIETYYKYILDLKK